MFALQTREKNLLRLELNHSGKFFKRMQGTFPFLFNISCYLPKSYIRENNLLRHSQVYIPRRWKTDLCFSQRHICME